VRVEVPPLLDCRTPVRTCPIFPGQHLIWLDSDPLIVLGC
jgi:hypothetical protein